MAMSDYQWDPAVWREPTWFNRQRRFGFRVWLTGGEVEVGRVFIRFRWMSR